MGRQERVDPCVQAIGKGSPDLDRGRSAIAPGAIDWPAVQEDRAIESEESKVEIPIDRLSPDALAGVVDDYVLREGTNYGAVEISLETKRAQVLAQLRSGQAIVLFDPSTETCTIALRAQ